MIRILAVLAALTLAVPVAQAASFDCTKATTPFEKAICGDPALSQQDEVLSQAYATALGGLSKPASDEVKAAQRSWLDYAQRLCSEDAQPISTPYKDDQLQCLGQAFRERIRGLEASRMEGGYRFYPVQRFLAEKDTEAEPDAYNKVASKEFTTVRIDGSGEVAAAFNAAIDTLTTRQGDFWEPGKMTIATGDVTSDFAISTRVDMVTTQRISLDSTEYWYGHGAAHGNYTLWHHHFLIEPRRLLEASDIFAGEGWARDLAALARTELEALLGEGMWDDLKQSDLEDWVADPLRWNFSEAGLVIQFQIYEVTAYAAGAPKITVPWSQLEEHLTDKAEQIATWGVPL